ncbi:MAG: DUF1513 domain-containing protein [Alphaproteobacteria bacterium]|nr:DUF1513 domain-containing protein [Alphaproteobacteria bacterium]
MKKADFLNSLTCSRREFVSFVMAAVASGALYRSIPSLAGDGDAPRECLIVASQKQAALIDLAAGDVKTVDIGFSAHSFVQHPTNPKKFIAIEKWGANSAEVDFGTGTQRPIRHGKDEMTQYYGHGFYHEAKKAIFITRVDITSGRGFLSGYNPDTYEIMYDYPVTPGGLHECHRMADGTYMVACSGVKTHNFLPPIYGDKFGPSSLVKVDVDNDGKVLGELPIHDDFIIGHFGLTKKNQVLALSTASYKDTNLPGNLYYSPDCIEPLKKIEIPAEVAKNLKGEMLSVALNEKEDLAAVTNPMGKTVLLINMENGTLVEAINDSWRSISYDPVNDRFIGATPNIEAIGQDFSGATPLSIKQKEGSPQYEFTGAHSIIKMV